MSQVFKVYCIDCLQLEGMDGSTSHDPRMQLHLTVLHIWLLEGILQVEEGCLSIEGNV